MATKKCPSQSFHLPKWHKGKYFIGCNYYGMIVDTKRCERCKVKRFIESGDEDEKRKAD